MIQDTLGTLLILIFLTAVVLVVVRAIRNIKPVEIDLSINEEIENEISSL